MTAQPPNLDLAVIGNCQIAALIDELGRIVWTCLPAPDGDPVFSALLSAEGGASVSGVFAVDLVNLAHREQRYVRNTAIVETTLHDASGGAVRITDFCPRYRARGRMFRPMMLVRIIEPVAGRPVVRLRLRPTSDYGRESAPARFGSHHLRFTAGDLEYRITTDASLCLRSGRSPGRADAAAGLHPGSRRNHPGGASHPRTRLPGGNTRVLAGLGTDAGRVISTGRRPSSAPPSRSSSVPTKIQALCSPHSPLPYRRLPDSERNWDYRYCWLRDSYFVIQALNRLGATRTMEAYLHYFDHILARSNDGDLQPLYSIRGDTNIEESTVTTLAGYRGMGPVRVGNQAASQVQHDVYGSVILATAQLFFDERLAQVGDRSLFERLQSLGNRAAAVYELPDAGPWERRGKLQTHTFSAAISWAGCDRLARIAARLGDTDAAHRWRRCADDMRARILERTWSEERKAFVSTFGGQDLDATALLLPELGLLTPDDRRFHSTVEAIGRELREGDLVFRYRHADDFGTPRSAFTVCAFWYVNALAADRARGRSARSLRPTAGPQKPAGPAVGRHRSVDRHAVGQLSSDLQHGRRHQQRIAPQSHLG